MKFFYRNKYVIAFSLIYLMFFFKLCYGHYVNMADDVWFSNVHDSQSNIFVWLKDRYFQWTSRIPIEFFLVLLITHFKIWVFINSFMFASLVLCITYYLNLGLKKLLISSVLVFGLVLWGMPKSVSFEAAIWMTGSFNYLWPVALAAISYLCLYKYFLCNSRLFVILSCIFVFLSSFNEQMAVVNFSSILISIVYFRLSGSKYLFLLPPLLSVCIVLVIIATCPGNMARYNIETAAWFEGFNSIGLFGKLVLGCNLYVDALVSKHSVVPLLSSLALIKVCNSFWAKCIAIFWSVVFLATLIVSPDAIRLNENDVLTFLPLMRAFLATLYLISVICAVSISRSFDKSSLVIVICFVCSAASIVFMGLSPTIYASGKRVFFVYYVIMIFLIINIFLQNKRFLNLSKRA
ncbi:DUF6056 family protein [Zymobacter sp. IVIA_12111.31 C1]|uniref:DUF6056 family protein n=1 Tax=Zymobacter sp. IVIA_12111.31 C1 TaxID=3394854 RepID=UPI0039C47026